MKLNNIQLNKIKKLQLKKKPLLKTQIKKLKNLSGKNNSGKITIKHRGGGHKKKYRKIVFLKNSTYIGITCNIEYDPNRSANIAAIYNFSNSKFFYILAPKKLKIGDIIKTNSNSEIKLGYCLKIKQIPIGSYIYNISSKISRSAGTYSKIKQKNLKFCTIKINSKKLKQISMKSFATIGIVSNELNFLLQSKKAGQSRWLNKRPNVRGVAMNPVDHPNGGGEGKKSGFNKNPWGKKSK